MTLHFRLEEHGAAQTVLFLHGFMGQAEDWQSVQAHLSGTFNLLAVDLPGHGKSLIHPETENELNAKLFFDLLNRLLERLAIRQLSVVGYSLGGRLALQWAVKYPQKVERLVLESVHPGLEREEARQERMQSDAALSARLAREGFDLPSFLQEWYAMPLFGKLREHAKFPELLQRRLQGDPRQWALALRAFSLGRQPALWNRLSDLPPTLVICGASDEKYRKIGGQMQKHHPELKLEIAAHCGHTVHFEAPRWFAEKIKHFLLSKEAE